jgi:hypothetical protein
MKNWISILVLLCIVLSTPGLKAQDPYRRIDALVEKTDSLKSIGALANYINRTYSSEYEKTRAIFYWLTQNISYAPELMYSFTTSDNRGRLAREVFENKAAVCIGYAALFDTLCKQCGIKSYVVLGSTRQSFLPAIIGHAWNAVRLFDEWQIVDATWGSGVLQNNRFVKRLNNYYFLPDPKQLISTHLPIDPIWQMLKQPVTLYQFHSQVKSTVTVDWNYNDSINQFLASDGLSQVKSVSRRLNEFGRNSEVTSNYANYLKARELEFYNVILNAALKSYNRAIEGFNQYVDFKNHQFTPARSDDNIRRIMPDIINDLDFAGKQYSLVINQITEATYIENINSNLRQLRDLRERANEEKKFVDKYLSTPKNKRRDLFYTKKTIK